MGSEALCEVVQIMRYRMASKGGERVVRLFLDGAAMIVPDLIARRRLHSSGSPAFRKASCPTFSVAYCTVQLG
jgi:hypothetical protein